jgi:hypothetical protein
VVSTSAHYSATPTSAFAYVLPAACGGNGNAPLIAMRLSGFYLEDAGSNPVWRSK